MEQWQIQRSNGKCAGTGRTLQPEEEYYAALVDKKNCFERCDYSLDYWQENKPQVFCFWKTRILPLNQKKKIWVDDAILINLFERLAEQQESQKIHFRFVLALILMRKRLLKYEDSQKDGEKEIWKMRFSREKEIHQVINPHLEEEQIQQLAQELRTILQGEI